MGDNNGDMARARAAQAGNLFSPQRGSKNARRKNRGRLRADGQRQPSGSGSKVLNLLAVNKHRSATPSHLHELPLCPPLPPEHGRHAGLCKARSRACHRRPCWWWWWRAHAPLPCLDALSVRCHAAHRPQPAQRTATSVLHTATQGQLYGQHGPLRLHGQHSLSGAHVDRTVSSKLQRQLGCLGPQPLYQRIVH